MERWRRAREHTAGARRCIATGREAILSQRRTIMAEATWGDDTKTPAIDWRMSASLEDVPRGSEDVAEVTSLEGAVRALGPPPPAPP
eukprot:gene29332-32928_t